MAAQGFTDQGIAHKLGISLATVGTYWGRVRIKFGPLNRTELVAIYLREESTAVISQLKQSNTELLSKVDEYAKSEEQLRASIEMFQALIGNAADAVLIVSDQGKIDIANRQAEELFGYEPGELAGLPLENLVPERYHEAHVENRNVYISQPSRRKMGEHLATVAKKKDGSEFSIAAVLNATTTPMGTVVTCLIRDIADQVGT